MSFRANDASMNQTSILDATALMSDREKRFLDKSWAKVFAEEIFPLIDEQQFAPMYSAVDSRPNTPVNVTVGALLLKEVTGMSDDEILNAMMFDIRFKVALHTTGMAEQPIGHQENPVTIAAGGAYSGSNLEEKAAENNVTIFNTNLTGREAKDIAADFKFNEDGTRVTECPNGKTPKSCSCSKAGTCTVSFRKEDCANCPYRDRCNPKEYARTTRVTISARTQQRAQKQRERKTDEFKKMSAFRNGVETVPSFLRRCFGVDRMPVRGKTRMSFFLGCKIGGLNVMKFCNFRLRRNPSAQEAVLG